MKRLLMAAAGLVLAACNPAPPAATSSASPSASPRAAAGIKLYAMDCGGFHIKDAASFSDKGDYDKQERDLVDPCYLIRHPTKGDLVWDAGLPISVMTTPPPGPNVIKLEKTIETQLTELGLKPADIEFFAISHSHYDHVGQAGVFAASTWIVDPDEKAWMFRPEAKANAINYAAIAPLETAKTALIEGDADFDVFGDGSAVIVQAPGHTPGHTVLLLKLAKAGPVLLAGDMWHLAEAREKRTVPKGNVDRELTLKSMDEVEALAKATGAKVIRQHVPEDFAALPKFPVALD